MSDQSNIFSSSTETTSGSGSSEEIGSKLESLVGEGKKFADAEALAKGKIEADLHLQTIESENEDLRKQLETKASLDVVLEEIKKGSQGNQEETTSESLSEQDVLTIMSREKRIEKATANLKAVDDKMKSLYGEAAQSVMDSKATSLGLDRDAMADMAANKPQVFMALFNNTSTPTGVVPTTSSIVSPLADKTSPMTVVEVMAENRKKGNKYLSPEQREAQYQRVAEDMGINLN